MLVIPHILLRLLSSRSFTSFALSWRSAIVCRVRILLLLGLLYVSFLLVVRVVCKMVVTNRVQGFAFIADASTWLTSDIRHSSRLTHLKQVKSTRLHIAVSQIAKAGHHWALARRYVTRIFIFQRLGRLEG